MRRANMVVAATWLSCALGCGPVSHYVDEEGDSGPREDLESEEKSSSEVFTDSVDSGQEEDDGPPPGVLPPLPRGCMPGTEWIYAAGFAPLTSSENELDDQRYELIRYQPDSNEITVIGDLDLSVGDFLVRPFSMAVDRNGDAWVLGEYPLPVGGGEYITEDTIWRQLFRCSTTDASCTPTEFVPATGGYEIFGMGFASEEVGSEIERLFIAGGTRTGVSATGESMLGVIDLTSFTIETTARLPGQPELTGTGEGNLWGYFPHDEQGLVQRVDKQSGETTDAYPTGLTLEGGAWAIAFWGGDFYIFYTRDGYWQTPSEIWHVDTQTGEVSQVVRDVGLVISGAGVSTCAPFELY